MSSLFLSRARNTIPLYAVPASDLATFLKSCEAPMQAFLSATGFAARREELLLIPDAKGKLSAAVLGLGTGLDPLMLAAFSEKLPAGKYHFAALPEGVDPSLAMLAWALGTYSFRISGKTEKKEYPQLVVPQDVDGEEVTRIAAAVFSARDLVNTPSNLMGPTELAAAAQKIAKTHKAKFRKVTGAALKKDYPLIAAVGQGSDRAPCMIDFTWGPARAPKLTLVGKGVCFDSGGYDIKPTGSMLTMKKDMGGAAVVLALANLIMASKLKVRLRVLIGAVENSVSGNAIRPMDVIKSRKGLTVEIGNTDAEGRLVLADLLADADAEKPDLLIDVATLTGAARVATGMDVPPFLTDDDMLAAELMAGSAASFDPLWRLPIWRGYESALDSEVADITNNPHYNLAGAITATLFLNRFVENAASWAHFDIAAWVDRPKPGRRSGGEATALRAIYTTLKHRYG